MAGASTGRMSDSEQEALKDSGIKDHLDEVREAPPTSDFSPAGLGSAVKGVRQAQGMRQEDLASAARLSVSFISQFERGLTDASINSLTRICSALGLTVGNLLRSNAAPFEPLKRHEMRSVELDGATKFVYSRPTFPGVDIYMVSFPPDGSTGKQAYAHPGDQEMVICNSGYVAVELGQSTQLLSEGDSVTFASEVPHRMSNIGKTPAEITWIVQKSKK